MMIDFFKYPLTNEWSFTVTTDEFNTLFNPDNDFRVSVYRNVRTIYYKTELGEIKLGQALEAGFYTKGYINLGDLTTKILEVDDLDINFYHCERVKRVRR